MSVFIDETKLAAAVRDLIVPALIRAVEPLVERITQSPLFDRDGFTVTVTLSRKKPEGA